MSTYREPCCWWPIGHLRGWKGRSGFGAKSSWRDVLVGLPGEILRKKTIVLTGATSGIGRETLRAFAYTGAFIIIGVRDEARAIPIANELMSQTGSTIRVLPLDLGAIDSVHSFAEAIFAQNRKVDILVNNAGLLPCPYNDALQRDELWHVNFVGHYTLTQRLLPMLARGARVVNVTSEVYRFSYRGGVRWGPTIEDKEGYDAVKSYAQSKLALILWTHDQGEKLSSDPREIQFFAVHPGSVKTEASERARNSSGWRGAILNCIGAPFVKSLECGAATTVYCALHPTARSWNHFGLRYFANCNPRRVNKVAADPVLARRVVQMAETTRNTESIATWNTNT